VHDAASFVGNLCEWGDVDAVNHFACSSVIKVVSFILWRSSCPEIRLFINI